MSARGTLKTVKTAALRSLCLAIVALLAFGPLLSPARADEAVDESDAAEPDPTEEPAITEVAQLPVMYEDPSPADPDAPITVSDADQNLGWLILNPKTRRGYQLFDQSPRRTIIQSFDLDTLQPRRRVAIPSVVLLHAAGRQTSAGTSWSGEVVHAFDEEGGRLFLPVSDAPANPPATVEMDTSRLLKKVLVIDEALFDAGDANYARDLTFPPNQQNLVAHGLKGMMYREESDGGKLLMLFAGYSPAPVRPIYDHYLAEWSVDGGAAWAAPHPLTACERAPLRADATGLYQVGFLHTDSSIFVACQSAANVTQVAEVPLDATGAPVVGATASTFPLPRKYVDVFADQVGGRLFLKTALGGEVWYVFDAASRSFVGAITALNSGSSASAGLDQTSGRFYALVPDYTTTATGGAAGGEAVAVKGGLMSSDTRLTPVPEAGIANGDLAYPALFRIVVDPVKDRVFVRRGRRGDAQRFVYPSTELNADAPVEPFYRVLKDERPVPESPSLAELDGLTMDVDEAEGVTSAAYDMSASGYGTRVVVTGGISAATDRGTEALDSRCLPDDRQLALGFVESVSVSNLVAAGRAVSLHADQTTRDDMIQPSERCWPAAFGATPAGTKDLDSGLNGIEHPWDNDDDGKDDFTAACSGDDVAKAEPERMARSFSATATCALADATVEGVSSGALTPAAPGSAAPVTVAFATSEARAVKAPGEGAVTEVRSLARGIEIAGVGSIGAIMTETSAYAGGRPGTAGTKFVRTICGIDLPTVKVAGCIRSDEEGRSDQQEQIVAALNRAFSRYGQARLRQPDAALAAGTPGGYLAGIQRSAAESFTDEKISRDASTAVPGLEIIFYRDDPFRGAGRQIYQFAGVKASSAYGISCLYGPAEPLETDTDTDTAGSAGDVACALPPEPDPSRLTVVLTDEDSEPLAGGVFEIHIDSDTDGVLGPDDEVIEGGSCITEDDGTGNCVFDELEPGAYVIEQTSAPPGYAKAPAFPHVVDPATEYTITFTNLKSVAGVQIGLTDDSAEAKPLAGGVFELFADDGDEILGQADVLYASCTTDETGACELEVALEVGAVGGPASGTLDVVGDLVDTVCEPIEEGPGCILDVPLGSYVVHQSAAPAGYAPADDVGFTFDQPGQMASLAFINGLEGSGVAVEATAGTPDIPPTPPTEVLVWEEGSGTPQPIVESNPLQPPKPSLADRASDVLTQVMRVPLEAFRFLFNNPREVGLMAAVWVLLFLPCYLAERRRVLDRLRTHIAPSEAA